MAGGVAEGLAAFRPAGEDLLARARILRAVVDLLHGLDLRRREAGCLVSPRFARQRGDIEVALSRIFDEPVLQGVIRIAGRNGGVRDQGKLRRRKDL